MVCVQMVDRDNYWYLVLLIVLLGAFSARNFLGFYIMFEMSLVPILLVILGGGYQPERVQACLYMMLYTVVASLPILASFLVLARDRTFFLPLLSGSPSPLQRGLLLLPFLVKLPIYGAHYWLPKAHVEAPTSGSIILAGILLKLGGYGLIVVVTCFKCRQTAIVALAIGTGVWGILVSSIVIFSKKDIKTFVAYRSVIHMSLVVLGVLRGTTYGLASAIVTILAHGMSRSALFCLAAMLASKTGGRGIPLIKGLLTAFPKIMLLVFVFCRLNMAAPPSLNLLGELYSVIPFLTYLPYLYLLLGLVMFLSVAINIFLYCSVRHGKMGYVKILSGTPARQIICLTAHLIPYVLLLKLEVMV